MTDLPPSNDDTPSSSETTPSSFSVLKDPQVDDIIALFKKSHEFKEIQLDFPISPTSKILSSDMWKPFMDAIVNSVREQCLATKKSNLPFRKKTLTNKLNELLSNFVSDHLDSFSDQGTDNCALPNHWKAVLRSHASNFLRTTKREMCNNLSEGFHQIKEIVHNAFTSDIVKLREEMKMQQSSKETLYYIAGWLLRASSKAAKRRDRSIADQLEAIVLKSTLIKADATSNPNIPSAKVEMVEQFGGLNYVSEDFFIFTERLEFIFRKTLTPELLIMNGSLLIQHVYLHLNADDAVLESIETFCDQNVDPDVTAKVAQYVTQTFCRMRGKDFARKIMSRDTNSLAQSRRPTLAAVANPALRPSKKPKSKNAKTPTNTTSSTFRDDTNIEENEITDEEEFQLFDAVSGNSSTEEKGAVDDDNLLQY